MLLIIHNNCHLILINTFSFPINLFFITFFLLFPTQETDTGIVNLTPYLPLLLCSNLLVPPPPLFFLNTFFQFICLCVCMKLWYSITTIMRTAHYPVPSGAVDMTGTDIEPRKEV